MSSFTLINCYFNGPVKYMIPSKFTAITPPHYRIRPTSLNRGDHHWMNAMTIENPPHTCILSLQGALHSPNLSTLGAYT